MFERTPFKIRYLNQLPAGNHQHNRQHGAHKLLRNKFARPAAHQDARQRTDQQ